MWHRPLLDDPSGSCIDLPQAVADGDVDEVAISTPVAAVAWHVESFQVGDLQRPQDRTVESVDSDKTMQALQEQSPGRREGRGFAAISVGLVARTRPTDPLDRQVTGLRDARELLAGKGGVVGSAVQVRPVAGSGQWPPGPGGPATRRVSIVQLGRSGLFAQPLEELLAGQRRGGSTRLAQAGDSTVWSQLGGDFGRGAGQTSGCDQ